MPSIKSKLKGKPIHSRSLDLKTYPVDDGKVIIEGWLKDDRFVQTFDLLGRKKDKGLVHHMAVRLLVGNVPLTILDAESEMLHVPHELCHTTKESIKKVIGMEIKTGFSDEVRRVIGGIEGCAHLTHLVIVLGQEAVHGYWTNTGSRPRTGQDPQEKAKSLSFAIDSCSIWREGGPLVHELEERIKSLNK